MITRANIREVMERIATADYNMELWRAKDLRRHTGIGSQDFLRLERKGIVPRASRDQSGRLLWTPREVYTMLELFLGYLERPYDPRFA